MRRKATLISGILLGLAGVFAGCGGRDMPNEAPTLTLEASSTYIKAEEEVTFTIDASDPEGGTVTADIDYGDGNSESGVAFSVLHTYYAEGEYMVLVEVTDDHGAKANASLNITVTPAGGSPDIRLNAVTLHIQTTEGPLDHVDVNGDQYVTDGDGNADVQVPLETGITTVSIMGQDPAGHQGSEDLEFEIQ